MIQLIFEILLNIIGECVLILTGEIVLFIFTFGQRKIGTDFRKYNGYDLCKCKSFWVGLIFWFSFFAIYFFKRT